MAYYDDIEDEEGQDPGALATGPEAAALGAGGAPAAAQAASAAAPAKAGGGFVGISEYINANKPQSEKLAGQVVDSVDQKAQMAEDSLGGLQSSFNQAADSQRVEADDDLLGMVRSNATQVAGDAGKASSFAKQRDASYGGPKTLESVDSGAGWAGLQSALQSAKGAKAATGTEEGRMGLIKEISNNPRQSQGALTFDNLLLQSNPNSASKLQNAGASLNDFDARLGTAQQGAGQKASEIGSFNSATSQKAKDALTGGFQGLGAELGDRESQADAGQAAEIQALRSGVKSGNLTPAQLQMLGMGGDDRTFGVDLLQFLQYSDGIDKNSVATQEDLGRQQALRQLAGDTDLGEDFVNSAALGQKGSGFTLDNAGYQQAQAGKQAEYGAMFEDKETAAWDRTLGGLIDAGVDGSLKDALAQYKELAAQGSNKEAYQRLLAEEQRLEKSFGDTLTSRYAPSSGQLGRISSSRSV